MPGAALANLQQPPPQQYALPLANIGSAIGSGGLAAMGGRPGANPYLTGLDDQQRSLFYQKLHAQQEQDRRMDRAFAHNRTLLTMERDTIGQMEDGPLKTKLAGQYAQRLGQFMGNPLYGAIGADIARKKLTPDQINNVLSMGAKKVDPNLIALQTGVPVEKVSTLLKMDPKYLERLGADDQASRDAKEVERKLKATELLAKQKDLNLPIELKRGSPEFVERVQAIYRKQNNGAEFVDGDGASRARASQAALDEIQMNKERIERMKAQFSLEKGLALLAARPVKPANAMTMMQKTKELGKIEGYDKLMSSSNEIRAMLPELDKLGVMAKGDDLLSQGKAQANMALFAAANPTVKRFKLLWPAFEVGQVSRGYFDEKNARQKQAFEEQLGITKGLPTRKAMEDYLDMLDGLTVDQMRTTIKRYETLGAPEDLIQAAQDVYAPWSHVKPRSTPNTSGAATPSGPLAAPRKVYNPKTGQIEVVQ